MSDFGPLGGVKISGFISPTDTNDTYAVIDPLYGIDGLRNLTGGTADLDTISELRRRAGMIVGVSGGTSYYKLKSGPWAFDITDWEEVEFGEGKYTTGSTLVGTTAYFDRNDSLSAYTLELSGLSVDNSISGATDTVISSPSDGDFLIYSGGNWINRDEQSIYFTASTSGQTIFNSVLPITPVILEKSMLFVNGVKRRYGASYDYIITGGTDVVWVSTSYSLDVTDEIEIIII